MVLDTVHWYTILIKFSVRSTPVKRINGHTVIQPNNNTTLEVNIRATTHNLTLAVQQFA